MASTWIGVVILLQIPAPGLLCLATGADSGPEAWGRLIALGAADGFGALQNGDADCMMRGRSMVFPMLRPSIFMHFPWFSRGFSSRLLIFPCVFLHFSRVSPWFHLLAAWRRCLERPALQRLGPLRVPRDPRGPRARGGPAEGAGDLRRGPGGAGGQPTGAHRAPGRGGGHLPAARGAAEAKAPRCQWIVAFSGCSRCTGGDDDLIMEYNCIITLQAYIYYTCVILHKNEMKLYKFHSVLLDRLSRCVSGCLLVRIGLISGTPATPCCSCGALGVFSMLSKKVLIK